MDGWMAGWMEGRRDKDGGMDGGTEGQGWRDTRMEGRIDGCRFACEQSCTNTRVYVYNDASMRTVLHKFVCMVMEYTRFEVSERADSVNRSYK